MNERRTLLYAIIDETRTVCVAEFSGYRSATVEKGLSCLCALADSPQILEGPGSAPLADVSGFSLYDWSPGPLAPDTSFLDVPKPGIVIAAHSALGPDFGPDAAKYIVQTLEDERIKQHIAEHGEQFGPETQVQAHEYEVFISYATEDQGLADQVRKGLQRKGLKCFMAGKDLKAGMVWENVIRDALHGSRVGVILLTPNSVTSKWVMCEAGAFWALEKPLVPALVYVSPTDVPFAVTKYQWVNAEDEKGRRRLYEEVSLLCEGAP